VRVEGLLTSLGGSYLPIEREKWGRLAKPKGILRNTENINKEITRKII
jgi:hypothetical protein